MAAAVSTTTATAGCITTALGVGGAREETGKRARAQHCRKHRAGAGTGRVTVATAAVAVTTVAIAAGIVLACR
jgi:hypothetical protein